MLTTFGNEDDDPYSHGVRQGLEPREAFKVQPNLNPKAA